MPRACASTWKALAEFERALIQERVRAGIAHARSRGKHIGRRRVWNGYSPLYAADQRIFQKAEYSESCLRFAFRVLQFRSSSPIAALHPGYAGTNYGSHMVPEGNVNFRLKVQIYCAVSIFFLGVGFPLLNASVGVIVITPYGIVMGADSKTVSNGRPFGTIQKIFLLRGRLSVACFDLEQIRNHGTGAILFDVPSWISQIDKNMDPKVSVTDFAGILGDQMPKAFLEDRVKRGVITKNTPGISDTLLECGVTGYESGIPMFYRIFLKANWDQKSVIGPIKDLVFPHPGDLDFYATPFGPRATPETWRANTKENNWLVARVPTEYRLLVNLEALSLKQGVNLVRATIGARAKFDPSDVGFPIAVVTLPKSGVGSVKRYIHDLPPAQGNSRERKQQNKKGKKPATQH